MISPKKCAEPISQTLFEPVAKSLFSNILPLSHLDARIWRNEAQYPHANLNESNRLARSYRKNIAAIPPVSHSRGLCVE